MSAAPVVIPRRLALKLLHVAQLVPGAEICGLIGADDSGPVTLYPVANVAPDPARAFHMDPAAQIAALKALRTAGQRLWGTYHSHPSAPPVPSAQDVAEAGYPEVFHLIVSLDIKGVLDLHCWEYGPGAPRARLLKIREHS
jgi:[CysO sulfur-carrier protein]-S-L-cysteine hydrolase